MTELKTIIVVSMEEYLFLRESGNLRQGCLQVIV
jgi:hypothetical protein